MRHVQTDPVFFRFEEDFVASGIRCIPMIVRFKLDACGIKLALAEWNSMDAGERSTLAAMPCGTAVEVQRYREFLQARILQYTGITPAEITVPEKSDWARRDVVPDLVRDKCRELNTFISLAQWAGLSDLQRFALVKLSRPGHENRNFPLAMEEFLSEGPNI